MISSQIYIAVSIVVLAILAMIIFVVRKNKKPEKLTRLSLLAFIFIFGGLIFNDNKLIGYGLMGIGIVFAIIDIIIQLKKKL